MRKVLIVLLGLLLAAVFAGAQTVTYKEAPVLAEQVKAGKLPPVAQRLPDKPLVVPADEIGTYGGVWRRGFLGPSDFNGVNRVIYDVLARFGPDGANIEMKLAESVTSSADFRTWIVTLRKGTKWSDGSPFTADDILFWYKDVLLNKDLVPAMPGWMLNKDGTPVGVGKVNDLTVMWTFKEPNTNFLLELTTKDFGDRLYPIFLPSTYLKQFHASYAKKETLDKMVADAKLKTWAELFAAKQNPLDNPERPGMAAWVASNRISDPIFVMKRNPYYIGVDKAGNQLPYIDEVQFKFFTDAQALNLAAIAGELDEQERHINLLNYPVLKDNEQKLGKYKIYLWSSPGRIRRGRDLQPDLREGPRAGQALREQGLPDRDVLCDQPRADPPVRVPRNGRGAPGRPEEGPSLLPRRRVRVQVHGVQARRGGEDARRDRPEQEGRGRASASSRAASAC